jgi:hypothetical protein
MLRSCVAQEFGIVDATAYIPHQHGDPIKHAHLTPRQVLAMDRENVRASQLIIMYTGRPSHGVGREHEWAIADGTPIIAMAESDRLDARLVSRLARVDIDEQISFGDFDDALDKLEETIKKVLFSQEARLLPLFRYKDSALAA